MHFVKMIYKSNNVSNALCRNTNQQKKTLINKVSNVKTYITEDMEYECKTE